MKEKKDLEENLFNLQAEDPAIAKLIFKEFKRQRDNVELIASENFTYRGAMEVAGSILTNKYAEGYPGKRYYGGCEIVDKIEELAIKRACKLFNCKYANVQPHSGSSANLAAYDALCEKDDTIMGLSLSNGGHLTHGCPINFSGRYYNAVAYELDSKTEQLNYDSILKLAKKYKPKVIIAGYSAYPRKINFKKFRDICNEVDAYLLVDMAHIAGLVAAGVHPSPLPYADVVTSTTHKTLRGPRSGIILTNKKSIAEKIDKAVFPGIQGGPLMHIIAAKALSFKMANTPEFKKYAKQIVANSKAMAKGLQNGGLRLVAGGTDNHLCLADVTVANTTGKEVEEACSKAKITINKNTIPGEKLSPFITSGIRVGTPAVTSRGFSEGDCYTIGEHIARIAFKPHSKSVREDAKHSAELILKSHPLY